MIAETDETTTTTTTPALAPTILPPGPGGRFASIAGMMRDLPGFLMQLRHRYGPIVRWQTGPLTWYLVADAEAVEQVLVKDAASYRKGSLQGWVADPILRGGPRICIGNQLATMEATLILAAIAQRYHVQLVQVEQPMRLMLAPTLRPRDPLLVRLEARNENGQVG